MRSKEEIETRIAQLKRAQKDNIDTSIEIDILTTSLLLSEEQIKTTAKNQIDHGKYREADVSIWLLRNS